MVTNFHWHSGEIRYPRHCTESLEKHWNWRRACERSILLYIPYVRSLWEVRKHGVAQCTDIRERLPPERPGPVAPLLKMAPLIHWLNHPPAELVTSRNSATKHVQVGGKTIRWPMNPERWVAWQNFPRDNVVINRHNTNTKGRRRKKPITQSLTKTSIFKPVVRNNITCLLFVYQLLPKVISEDNNKDVSSLVVFEKKVYCFTGIKFKLIHATK